MEPDTQPVSSTRSLLAIVAAIGLAWQLVLIVLAFRHGNALRIFLRDLGVQPPMVTRLFLATYEWWPVMLVLSALVAFLPLRRMSRLQTRAILAAAVPLLVGLILQAWTDEAAIAPLYQIIRTVK